jgi:photosystem II stability/assembly factor-like uncharacterized protein
MKRFISITMFLFMVIFYTNGFSQMDVKGDLAFKLKGKRKFNDIVYTVHSYYNEYRQKLKPTDNGRLQYINRQMKFWTRWELFNRARLNEKGEIVNVEQLNWNMYETMQQTTSTGSYGFWAPIGPTSFTRLGQAHGPGLGRVNCIAFHPSVPDVLYIGCPAGGLWRSSTGGNSWVPLTDHIPSTGIAGIVISHNNPNTIYILTGDGDGGNRTSIGVLKSTDAGQNWHKTASFPGIPSGKIFNGYKLIQDPINANILFAATTEGVFKTITAGESWTLVQDGLFTDIEFKPGDHNAMYAAANGASPFYRSFNNGGTWTNDSMIGVPANPTRLAIAVSAASPDYVYLLAGPVTDTGYFKGVYRSVNSGSFFILSAFTPNILGGDASGNDIRDQSTYDLSLAVDPASAANVIVGGINVWSSSFSGSNFVLSTNGNANDAPPLKYVHADIHDLSYNLLNNKLYVCSDGGVAVSSDNGQSWDPIWDGLQIMQFYHLSGYEPDYTVYIGGTQDNGSNYRKSSSFNYFHVLGADGYSSVIDYTDPNTIFCSGNMNLHRSFDGGNSETNISPTDETETSWPMVAMHPTNHNVIFAGKKTAIFKSPDQGDDWTNIGAGGDVALTVCPSNPAIIYASKSTGTTYRLTENGNSYSNTILNKKSGFPDSLQVTDIAVHPFNAALVWLTIGGYNTGKKVYFSSDFGESWTNISDSLPNVATTAIAIDNNGNAYVGTDVGVFYRGFSVNDWVPFYNGLPKTPVTDLVINSGAGVITAATYGRGLFQSPLYSTCFPTLSLAGAINGNRFYEAANWISSTHIVFGGTGTDVFYRAGDSIIMRNGFEVKEGSSFKAYLSPCASGIPTQSVISTKYKVSDINEIVKEAFVKTNDQPVKENQEIIPVSSGNEKEMKMSLPQQQFTQVYFQEEDTQEILLWLVRSSLSAGQYRVRYNDDKLKNGKVNLIIDVGGNKKTISVR